MPRGCVLGDGRVTVLCYVAHEVCGQLLCRGASLLSCPTINQHDLDDGHRAPREESQEGLSAVHLGDGHLNTFVLGLSKTQKPHKARESGGQKQIPSIHRTDGPVRTTSKSSREPKHRAAIPAAAFPGEPPPASLQLRKQLSVAPRARWHT